MGVFSKEDRIVISQLYILKGYGAKRLVKEFPTKDWKVRSLNKLLHKLRETGTTDRQIGSGRPRSVRTDSNISTASESVQSWKDALQTHCTSLVAKSADRPASLKLLLCA